MRSPVLSRAEEQELAALRSQTGCWDVSAEELRRRAPELIAREQAWQDKRVYDRGWWDGFFWGWAWWR